MLCICLRPHFLASLLGTIPLHPSMFLTLPLYLFPFFSFHLRRLRAYLIHISFLRSMWLFCYSRQLTMLRRLLPHAFHSGCSRLMTVRQRLLPHAHHTGPDLEPYSVQNPYCRQFFLYLTFS